ncbi:MAG TPA: hypothetical protein HPP87_09980 [Planctomycetes bacterium]|nr:hypothetical protein [Planctomycetota bacterium]
MAKTKLLKFKKLTCKRCGARVEADPVVGSQAKYLRRAVGPEGLCIHCAVHDMLRHLYPANMMLARSGAQSLLVPEIQKRFDELLQAAGTDARPGEIDWPTVVHNWDLPFAMPVKRSAQNPVDQCDLDAEEAYAIHQRRPDCNIWDERRRCKKELIVDRSEQ